MRLSLEKDIEAVDKVESGGGRLPWVPRDSVKFSWGLKISSVGEL